LTSVVRPDPRTGKLVRSVVVARKPVADRKAAEPAVQLGASSSTTNSATETRPPSSASVNLGAAVDRIAVRYGLAPELLDSVIKVESNYNANAVSPKGALGIMQLIPSTARRFGVLDVFDPMENMEGGARYLRYLLDLFGGERTLALAAYNAGEGAVAKYGTIPPYRETRDYIDRVHKHLQPTGKTPAAKPQEPARASEAQPAEPQTDGNHVVEVVGDDGTVHYVSR
jgi:soluble lytic murein transglycosylase-like protein